MNTLCETQGGVRISVQIDVINGVKSRIDGKGQLNVRALPREIS